MDFFCSYFEFELKIRVSIHVNGCNVLFFSNDTKYQELKSYINYPYKYTNIVKIKYCHVYIILAHHAYKIYMGYNTEIFFGIDFKFDTF